MYLIAIAVLTQHNHQEPQVQVVHSRDDEEVGMAYEVKSPENQPRRRWGSIG